MMNKTDNYVKIAGILSEVALKESSYTDKKTGSPVAILTGTITVKTKETIAGKQVDLEIPTQVFVNKFYNGELSNAYSALKEVSSWKSIANYGEDEADCVEIVAKRDGIRMNEFFGRNGQFVSYPRINAQYVNKIEKSRYVPQAIFSCDMIIQNIVPEVDTNGRPTGRLAIKGATVSYNDYIDLVDFYTADKNISNSVEPYWIRGKMVHAEGKLNFTVQTEMVSSTSDFGDPIMTPRTKNISELVICGGKRLPYEQDMAPNAADLENGLRMRQLRLENLKNKAAAAPMKTAKPAPSQYGDISSLGF